MSDEQNDIDALFVDQPEFLHVEGVGEVPVIYTSEPEPDPPPPVYPDDRLVAVPNVASMEIGDEFVLFDAATSTAHVLNSTASLLWQCMDGEGSVSEIFTDLADAFGISPDTVANDFVPVIARWKQDGLLTQAGTSDLVQVAADGAPGAARRRHLVDPPNN